jgi:hypothetical protein
MNITHGLRRALQVKSRGTATIFEGRREAIGLEGIRHNRRRDGSGQLREPYR